MEASKPGVKVPGASPEARISRATDRVRGSHVLTRREWGPIGGPAPAIMEIPAPRAYPTRSPEADPESGRNRPESVKDSRRTGRVDRSCGDSVRYARPTRISAARERERAIEGWRQPPWLATIAARVAARFSAAATDAWAALARAVVAAGRYIFST